MKKKIFSLLLLLTMFFGFGFVVNAQTAENVGYSDKNLASPDLEGKEYLGDGIYRLYNNNDITIDYNVYSGVFNFNGTVVKTNVVSVTNNNTPGKLTAQLIYVDGLFSGTNDGWQFATQGTAAGRVYFSGLGGYIKTLEKENIDKNLDFIIYANSVYNNYKIKLQLEQGDTATPYAIPIKPYLEHEKQFSGFIYFIRNSLEKLLKHITDMTMYLINNIWDTKLIDINLVILSDTAIYSGTLNNMLYSIFSIFYVIFAITLVWRILRKIFRKLFAWDRW